MEHDAWKKFVGVGIEKVWITDSCPVTAKAIEGIEPFEALGLAGSVPCAILQGAY